jgi:Calcineurin-like phosphoesterase
MIRKHVQPRSSMFIFIAVLGLCLATMPGPVWAAEPWSFVIFGDTRGDWDVNKTPPFDTNTVTGVSLLLPQIAEKIASLNPDFVLVIGDLIMGDGYEDAIQMGMTNLVAISYADQFRAWSNAMSSVYAANIPIYTVRGNHEVSNTEGVNGNPDPTLAAAYYQAFGQYMPQNYDGSFSNQLGLTYSFTHKQLTVVAMDQYSQYVAPFPARAPTWYPTNTWGTNFWGYHAVDQAWVSNQLHQANTPFKIVFAHEPIYEACTIPVTPPLFTYPWSAELYFGPTNFGGIARRQSFVDMLGANGVQLYAVGHVHNMSIGSFNDDAGHMIYQLTAGNGGASPLDDTDVTTNEPTLHGVRRELTKFGFTQVTVNPDANTMTMQYHVLNTNNSTWSQESFSTQIAGSLPPAAAGDIDGDGLADLIRVIGSDWYAWFSRAQYQAPNGPFDLGVAGMPAMGDIDGDGKADLVTVVGSNWYVWFSRAQYQTRNGPFDLGITGLPALGDVDGDGLADLIEVVGSNWFVWFSTSQYQVCGGPYDLGIVGLPATGDVDGDGLADLIDVVGRAWYVTFSTTQYTVRGGPYDMGIAGTPLTGDLDGDGLADLITVAGSNWYVLFSTSQYTVRGGPYELNAP